MGHRAWGMGMSDSNGARGTGMSDSMSRRDQAKRRGPARIAAVDVDLEAFTEPYLLTDLSAVPGRNDRFRVSVNGHDIGDVTIDFIADSGIREAQQISREQVLSIVEAVNRTIVLDKALDLLAVRARSSRDLAIRLRRAGARNVDISWTVARLESQGFLDDASYARQVARSKAVTGGVSRRNVISTLRKKGISADVAEEAISETLSEVDLDEYGAALAIAQKRVRALASLDAAKRKQRLYAFLARRGYQSDVIRKVLAEVL